MSDPASDRLYNLLPSIYRLRDAEQGEPLRALLSVIERELRRIETDIGGLYENMFVETCDEWVVPYIGDLLGVRGLHSISGIGFSQRAYVANTLSYRRSKGTAAVLERLARDVTGWPAHAVEFFQTLATTQYSNHIRPGNHRTPDLRDANSLNLLDGPFDRIAHTADVRHIARRRGRHNIPNVGLFLWRLQSYPLNAVKSEGKPGVSPRQADAPHEYGYHFSPLGNPSPLFTSMGGEGSDEELLVPSAIRPLAFYLDLKRYQELYESVGPLDRPANSDYYGPERSFQIVKDGTPVPPLDVMCKNLSAWERPPSGKVAVDVELGRLAFAAGEEPQEVSVDYNYGFSADIGGGPYDRRDVLAETGPETALITVGQGTAIGTLEGALQEWENQGKPKSVIRIDDDATYEVPPLTIELPNKGRLVIESSDGRRPHLRLGDRLKVVGPSDPATVADTASLALGGLLVEGAIEAEGKLDLAITDCTLVPGISLDEDGLPPDPYEASLVVGGDDLSELVVSIERSITGPLKLPKACEGLTIRDSIIDAPVGKGASEPARPAIASDDAGDEPGPPVTIERSTVFGKVHVKELRLASEVIFTATVLAERKQAGCVRFSHVPEGSKTPRRYYCQPELELGRRAKELGLDSAEGLPTGERDRIVTRLRPRFTSTRYGGPAFSQLGDDCAEEIRTGAEDGSEMGAFSHLKQPQREANLRAALNEYLRFSLEAGIIFVT
ncbi:MAG TPA: hypothetical protein VE262_08215 [Blastocatellia bacterium]|nr:hypothetical protein [Blastocatellia bacterium]